MPMKTYEIQCGQHRGVVEARDEFSAWRKVVGNAADGFGKMARFREATPATKGRRHHAGWQPWQYVTPRHLDLRGR